VLVSVKVRQLGQQVAPLAQQLCKTGMPQESVAAGKFVQERTCVMYCMGKHETITTPERRGRVMYKHIS